MVKDEDTTPVALRAALLRRDTTSERAKTSKSRVLSLVLACICAASLCWHLLTFENAADLRFFGGIAWPLDLWLAYAANATVLELPCDQISQVYAAQQPIIFRSCIPEGVGLADIGYFPDEQQNLFTPCDEKLIRDFDRGHAAPRGHPIRAALVVARDPSDRSHQEPRREHPLDLAGAARGLRGERARVAREPELVLLLIIFASHNTSKLQPIREGEPIRRQRVPLERHGYLRRV